MSVLKTTSYESYCRLSEKNQPVIIAAVVPLQHDVIACFAVLRKNQPTATLLDFHTDQKHRFSFIGLDPMTQLEARDGITEITANQQQKTSSESPFVLLRKIRLNPIFDNPACRLTASPIGFLGYHAVSYIEDLPTRHTNSDQIPEISINLFKTGCYFDHKEKTLTVSQLIAPNNKNAFDAGTLALSKLLNAIQDATLDSCSEKSGELNYDADIDSSEFENKVKIAKNYIKCGDIFQVVLSRTFKQEFTQDPLLLYQKIVKLNPSPYQFYLQQPGFVLVGSSPEKIIAVKNRKITSTPLAGTRAYTNNVESVIQELKADEKETAEHMMLVDLARNDVGKVAHPGSVTTPKIKYPLVLKNIIHLASDVEGDLDEKYDAIDALIASFPAGTLSGAPKIRAMQIIDELENSYREIYGGCIVALDHFDNLETCIVIRNALIKNNMAYVRAGCGVVYDSNPAAEEQETRHKAYSMLAAIAACNQGIKSC